MADHRERFRPVQGLPGKLYLPQSGARRKHPCAECFSCQWCADTRCTVCRGDAAPDRGRKNPKQHPGGKE